VPSSPCDKRATWRSIASLGWAEPRLRHELAAGWPHRLIPHRTIDDWKSDPGIVFDIGNGVITITIGTGALMGSGYFAFGIWHDRQSLTR